MSLKFNPLGWIEGRINCCDGRIFKFGEGRYRMFLYSDCSKRWSDQGTFSPEGTPEASKEFDGIWEGPFPKIVHLPNGYLFNEGKQKVVWNHHDLTWTLLKETDYPDDYSGWDHDRDFSDDELQNLLCELE